MDNPIYFVSDNHFQKRNDKLERNRRVKFYSLLDHIKDTQGSLVIAGDFFEHFAISSVLTLMHVHFPASNASHHLQAIYFSLKLLNVLVNQEL